MNLVELPITVLKVEAAILLEVVPNGRQILQQALSADLRWVAFVACAILLLATAGLLLAAMARFRRARLILD